MYCFSEASLIGFFPVAWAEDSLSVHLALLLIDVALVLMAVVLPRASMHAVIYDSSLRVQPVA